MKSYSKEHKVCVSIDLDDTLFKEIDFLLSGYRQIITALFNRFDGDKFEELKQLKSRVDNPFAEFLKNNSMDPQLAGTMLKIYREHVPDISLVRGASEFLRHLKNLQIPMCLVTDGRSLTQRNKIAALRIGDYFDQIYVSEEVGAVKDEGTAFRTIMNRFPGRSFVYIGDNPAKDFRVPNELGWSTVMVRDEAGENIHKQQRTLSPAHAAQYTVAGFEDPELLQRVLSS